MADRCNSNNTTVLPFFLPLMTVNSVREHGLCPLKRAIITYILPRSFWFWVNYLKNDIGKVIISCHCSLVNYTRNEWLQILFYFAHCCMDCGLQQASLPGSCCETLARTPRTENFTTLALGSKMAEESSKGSMTRTAVPLWPALGNQPCRLEVAVSQGSQEDQAAASASSLNITQDHFYEITVITIK